MTMVASHDRNARPNATRLEAALILLGESLFVTVPTA